MCGSTFQSWNKYQEFLFGCSEPETEFYKDLSVGERKENRPDCFRLWTQKVFLLDTRCYQSQGHRGDVPSHKVSVFKRIVEPWEEHIPELCHSGRFARCQVSETGCKAEVRFLWHSEGQGSIPGAACQLRHIVTWPTAHLFDTRSSQALNNSHPASSPPAVASTVGPGVSYLPEKGHRFLLQDARHQSYRLSWWEINGGSCPSLWIPDHLSSGLSLLPPLHSRLSRMPSLLASRSSTSFQNNSLPWSIHNSLKPKFLKQIHCNIYPWVVLLL